MDVRFGLCPPTTVKNSEKIIFYSFAQLQFPDISTHFLIHLQNIHTHKDRLDQEEEEEEGES